MYTLEYAEQIALWSHGILEGIIDWFTSTPSCQCLKPLVTYSMYTSSVIDSIDLLQYVLMSWYTTLHLHTVCFAKKNWGRGHGRRLVLLYRTLLGTTWIPGKKKASSFPKLIGQESENSTILARKQIPPFQSGSEPVYRSEHSAI